MQSAVRRLVSTRLPNGFRSYSQRIIPTYDRILVQRVKAKERTASGIFIPEKAQEVLNEGIVIETGPGVYNGKELTPVSFVKGDRVLLPPYGGNVVKLGSEEFTLFKDSEILAKLQSSEAKTA